MAIARAQALEFFRSDDLIGLGMEADTLRQSLHPEGVVTYTIDRLIHYACFRRGYCSVCNISRVLGEENRKEEARIVDCDTIFAQVAETVELGGTGVSLRGGQHADLTLPWFEGLFEGIRQRFPGIRLHGFSAPEILGIARQQGLTVHDTLSRLRDAGLSSISGNGAEIRGDYAPRPDGWRSCSTEEWVSVHRSAHELGMRTTAAMTFGQGETCEERVRHLEEVRRLQETTGGFAAFIPWSYHPDSHAEPSAPEGGDQDQATSVECLKTLAVSRLYLDNIDNVQAGEAGQDLKVLQLGLRFGGNDLGSALNTSLAAPGGGRRSSREEDLRRVIRDAGFEPVQRDTLYTTCFLN